MFDFKHNGQLNDDCVLCCNIKKESPIDIICSQRDVFDTQSIEELVGIDIVIVDVPYGDLVSWSSTETDLPEKFLYNIRKVVSSNSIVAVVSDKKQKFNSPLFKRKEKFNCGLRQVVILEPI